MADEYIRLLLCNVCNSIEELEDFSGPPEYDTLLINLLYPHKFPSGDEHKGHLLRIEKKSWDNKTARREIIKQIREGSGGLKEQDSKFYETRDTFRDDALTCWKQHNRTTNCGDYKSESKRLVPDTRDDWKQAGIYRPKKTPWDRYLCNFCPFESVVKQIEMKKRGM
jgi:hypothetical protein